jgi:hypothetical protein
MTFNPYDFGHKDPADWPRMPGGFSTPHAALREGLELISWASQYLKPETLAFRAALAMDDENPELDEQLVDDIDLLFKLALDLQPELEDVLAKVNRNGRQG